MLDIHKQFELFLKGKEPYAYKWMGAHLLRNNEGIYATRFILYAPNAKRVSLLGSFNDYDDTKHVMLKVSEFGLFSITIYENLEWETYRYKITTKDNEELFKSDPFAFFAEERPNNASRVYDINGFNWSDQKYLNNKTKVYDKPVLIYEMHFGSWQRKYGMQKKYTEVIDDLINYIKDTGYTHVEFLPIYEHPLDASWGYQGTGFFAATSRYGSPKDLMYLIDRLHNENIGVILDWVLGHINKDSFGLFKFDGTYLYEIEDEKTRENVIWGTANLDFNKGITKSFMTSALTFWLTYFHLDGFRIDAVSNLIYYLGNSDLGENKFAINYLKELSTHLFKIDDNLIFSAEDSTSYPKVTHPVYDSGLGFNYKWNMGFMNDTVEYFKLDPIYRSHHSNLITFSSVYMHHEQFILPFSHDEVVHMKGSLINKMPGSYDEKMANWRLILAYYMTFPGKKLFFMGQDFASFSEWDFNSELDWHLLVEFEAHKKAHQYFKDLAKVYKNHEALFSKDHKAEGFKWLINDHDSSSVFSYLRKGVNEELVIVLNMTPNSYLKYEVGVPYKGEYEVIFNSNNDIYDGNEDYYQNTLKTNKGVRNNNPYYLNIKLGFLSAVILKLKK